MITILCLCSCSRTPTIVEEASSIEATDYDEITFEAVSCSADAVIYAVSSTKEDFLFYEGHGLAYMQRYIDGGWHTLVTQNNVSTAEFRGETIPTEESRETIYAATMYGGRLESGQYRLVATCYSSAEDLMNEEHPVYLVTEFEID